jgi:hypothetical protein
MHHETTKKGMRCAFRFDARVVFAQHDLEQLLA